MALGAVRISRQILGLSPFGWQGGFRDLRLLPTYLTLLIAC